MKDDSELLYPKTPLIPIGILCELLTVFTLLLGVLIYTGEYIKPALQVMEQEIDNALKDFNSKTP